MSDSMYVVSSSPHIRSNDTVQNVMRDVLIALAPATIASIYFFKLQAALIIVVSIISAVAAEALWQKVTKQKITVSDYSAAITGLLIAFNLPPAAPLWIPVVGSFFAIIIVKQFFGGLGQNFMNPALAARAFLVASWPVIMTTWTVDGVASATALGILKEGGAELPGLWNIFIGNVGGTIGETSALALLIGGAYLVYKKVISINIPASYIGTVFVMSWIFGRNGFFTGDPVYEIFAGGLMLGAIFMATDYSSSPMTPTGQIIMGVGCGIITTVIRVYGGYPEGVSYSILLMNLAVPLIDQYTIPKAFGEVK
ncbi:electron transport complex subunit RnfD [Oxobacter pfennigii]|uniref:Ion-translocating oxidoreductase complex subunit D n=1 Tax=Oxobacter pfennigii TaxID=36849 RepID=A0A0P8WZD4_9CLOT|nr:RnfABCDGE type electron transport complex subunit D [Oxobacter pfennigii]KPU43835.1 electron transport complex subunit RnfD [Oxobacter pfennigii]